MTSSQQPGKERLEELLADRALFGLDADEQREFEELLARYGHEDLDHLDRVAAQVDLALVRSGFDPLPEAVADRVRRKQGPLPSVDRGKSSEVTATGISEGDLRPARPATGPRLREGLGWFVAICLGFALLAVGQPWQAAPAPSLTQQRQALINSEQNLLRLEWQLAEGADGAPVEGDVVWSNSLQKGFLRFKGLPPNDPSRAQYQLWVKDGRRGSHPLVDGGVFDVGGNEVIVPIDAKLVVFEPELFAVTVEEPGGVVVSEQSPTLVAAAE